MFKPECIYDDIIVFGIEDTIKLVKAKFMRLGKNAKMAQIMAYELVYQTILFTN